MVRIRYVALTLTALMMAMIASPARADVGLFIVDDNTGDTSFFSSPGTSLTLTNISLDGFTIGQVSVDGSVPNALTQSELNVTNTGPSDSIEFYATVTNVNPGQNVQMVNAGNATFTAPGDEFGTIAALFENNTLYQGSGRPDFLGSSGGFTSPPLSDSGQTVDTFSGVVNPVAVSSDVLIGLNTGDALVTGGVTTTLSAVPEPTALTLSILGGVACLGYATRSRKRAA